MFLYFIDIIQSFEDWLVVTHDVVKSRSSSDLSSSDLFSTI